MAPSLILCPSLFVMMMSVIMINLAPVVQTFQLLSTSSQVTRSSHFPLHPQQQHQQQYLVSLFSTTNNNNNDNNNNGHNIETVHDNNDLNMLRFNRRQFGIQSIMTAIATTAVMISSPDISIAAMQDSMDVDTFLRTGIDTGGGMGVSSQAGKSKPITGVILRDGTDIIQDKTSGIVTAEILIGTKINPYPLLVSFQCPYYKLEKSSIFDIECRDVKTGDGIFVAVSDIIPSNNNNNLQQISSEFLVDRLFNPTGRFSFYGAPTNIKINKDYMNNDKTKRYIEISFSNLSQSTNSEIPRKALLVAIMPPPSPQQTSSDNNNSNNRVVMLVGTSSALRWKKVKDVSDHIQNTIDTFEVLPSPKTNLKIRVKDRMEKFV